MWKIIRTKRKRCESCLIEIRFLCYNSFIQCFKTIFFIEILYCYITWQNIAVSLRSKKGSFKLMKRYARCEYNLGDETSASEFLVEKCLFQENHMNINSNTYFETWVYFKGFYLNVTAYFKIGYNGFIVSCVLKFSFYLFVS